MPSLVQTITTSTGVGAVPAFTLIAPLPELGFETRHMQAVLTAQINKTDRNDARGITGGALSSGACEDDTQSETADAAETSQAATVEGDRNRE